MTEALSVFSIFPVPPDLVYKAWLDSEEHSAFTNRKAIIDPRPGGKFSFWDGYVTGETVVLEPFHIIQNWRTSDFPEDAPDSLLEIYFEFADVGCQIIINHTGLPDGTADDFEQAWDDFYISPMQGYFSREVGF
jgi:activator of HSP90 ATPase